jgi:hypothetical protein
MGIVEHIRKEDPNAFLAIALLICLLHWPDHAPLDVFEHCSATLAIVTLRAGQQ